MANFELGNLVWKITGNSAGFDKNIKKADKTAKGFGNTLKKALAIAAIALAVKKIANVGKALIGIASDAEETKNKFDVVFKDVGTDAGEAFRDLAENYGIARTEARGLLADNADMLQGFGVASKESLELAKAAAVLGADLASFTNAAGGAAQVTADLGKLMLGERETVKKYGIAISETGLKEFAAEQGLVYAEMSKGEKATLSLKLAIQQSQNAVGDFQRSMASFANQSKIAQARLTDLKTIIGEALLPVATKTVTGVNKIIKAFIDMDGATKKTLFQIAAVIAIAPAVILAIKGISIAVKFLAANPITLVVAALAALVIALVHFQNKADQVNTERIEKEFVDLREEANLTTKEILKMDNAISRAFKDTSFLTVAEEVDVLAERFGVAKSVIIEIAAEHNGLRESVQGELDIMQEQVKERKKILALVLIQEENQRSLDGLMSDGQRTLKDTSDTMDKIEQTLIDIVALDMSDEWIKLNEQADILKSKKDLGLIDRQEQLKGLVDLNLKWIDTALELGASTSDARIVNALARIELLKESLAALAKEEAKNAEEAETREAQAQEFNSKMISRLEHIKNFKAEAHDEDMEDIEEEKQARRDAWAQRLDTARGYFSSITKIADIFRDGENTRIDNREKKELRALDNLSLSAEEKEKRKNAIEEKFARLRAIQKTKEAKADKAAAIFEIALSTSVAAIQALPNLILSGIIAGLGLAEGIAIASKPIPDFNFAGGGIVPRPAGTPMTGDNVVAGLNPDEEVLKRDDPRHAKNGGGGMTINQYNMVNTDSQSNLQKAARILFPALAQEGLRRG